jgi:DHA2 family multidrug resistance protein
MNHPTFEASPRAVRPAASPRLIAVAVSVATFMEVLDTSIVNVARRFVASSLSTAENDNEMTASG